MTSPKRSTATDVADVADVAEDRPAFSFEVVSLDAARQALEQPPAGVPQARVMTEADWKPRRRALDEAERRPSHSAMQWLLQLPAELRPTELIKRYPRIANKLAAGWTDAEATRRHLDELVLDRRGGRRGFPAQVAQELLRLREAWLRGTPQH